MYCTKCGTENPQDAKYCYECGFQLKDSKISKNKYEVINDKVIKIYKENKSEKVKKRKGIIYILKGKFNIANDIKGDTLQNKRKILSIKKMYKLNILVTVILLCVILFAVYIVSYKLFSNSKINNAKIINSQNRNVVSLEGNTTSNILNSGIISEKNNWIYYNDSDGLYKMKSDGGSITKISKDNSDYINVVNNYIYYSNLSDGNSIYKIKTDGSDRSKIINTSVKSINVLGKWVYYCKSTENGLNFRLYKINLDGSNNTKISDDSIVDGNFTVVNGFIYYKVNSENGGEDLYRCKLDGSQKHKLLDNIDNFTINDKNIYYYTSLNNGGLFKVNLDGTNKTKLSDDVIDLIAISDNNIYYTVNQHINKILYSIDLNGKNKTKLYESNDFTNLNVTKNLLFFNTTTSESYAIKNIDISNISLSNNNASKKYDIDENQDYILHNSNTVKLKEEDLKNLTKDQLILARNELFARHGYIFNTPEFKEYFESKKWYHPDIFFNGELKDSIEKYNFNLIKKVEDSK